MNMANLLRDWLVFLLDILNSKMMKSRMRQASSYSNIGIIKYNSIISWNLQGRRARGLREIKISYNIKLMQTAEPSAGKPSTDSSNNKSSRPTLRLSNTPLPIREESSVLSLNFSDLQTLMKRKEKQYQAELQIADAKRVHGFLSEVQAQQKEQSKAAVLTNRKRIKQATEHYNNEALARCQAEWKLTLQKTLNQLEEVGRIADEQHEEQLQRAQQRLEDAKNGKTIDKAKFSKTVLEMEDQLNKLVKAQRYEEAQLVYRRLQQRKTQEVRQLLRESVERQRRAIQQLKKKQNTEKQMLTSRLAQVYQIQQERRAKSIDKLVKNIRTYEIDPNKLTFSVQRKLRAKVPRSRAQSVSAFESPSINKEDAVLVEAQKASPS